MVIPFKLGRLCFSGLFCKNTSCSSDKEKVYDLEIHMNFVLLFKVKFSVSRTRARGKCTLGRKLGNASSRRHDMIPETWRALRRGNIISSRKTHFLSERRRETLMTWRDKIWDLKPQISGNLSEMTSCPAEKSGRPPRPLGLRKRLNSAPGLIKLFCYAFRLDK